MESEGTYDEQLAKATQMSLSDSQTIPGQETGVTYGNTYFGPPTQSHYENDQWALTVPEANTQEIRLDPEPLDRKRLLGTPALLKPTTQNRDLAVLLKIFHEIPMAREALLNREYLIGDYGRDNEWWNGAPIKSLRVVNMDEDDRDRPLSDVLQETQRLMAFLDDTDRTYGSADVLATLPALEKVPEADNLVAVYLEKWMNASLDLSDDDFLCRIFGSSATKRAAEEHMLPDKTPFTCPQIRVDSENADRGFSLYEAFDDLFWTNTDEIFLDELGEILTFEVQNHTSNSTSLGVTIPAIWYADRYLESAIPEAKIMNQRKAKIYEETQGIDDLKKLMTEVQNPSTGKTVNTDLLLVIIAKYLTNTKEYKCNAMNPESDKSMDASPDLEPLAAELAQLGKSIAEKLEVLEELKGSYSQRIMEVCSLLKGSSGDPNHQPKHKYTLRGVRTHPHSFYVLERKVFQDEDKMSSSDSSDYEWWKIQYDSSSSNPVQTKQVTENEVLTAASTDCNKALLVYASDRAVSYTPETLPPQLLNFVRADNLAFQAEIDNFIAQDVRDFDPPTIPKRKANDSDLEVEYNRSPGARSNGNASSSTSSSPLDEDPTDPFEDDEDYSLEPRPPPPKLRPLEPKPRQTTGSSDDHIPVSLRGGQEMQESTSGRDLLRQYQGKYQLGSYKPEIDMDDDDDGYVAGGEGRNRD
ncbi:uncharacterized protein KY384_003791 [Bacidia gigantensis]|uniref:uncharacterized protein n=1 Tax=Bacidia gigantensis TaxID=2732470 RepID=UPI001D04FEB9|nr:uncharacterized protein KY384_003791 [Bacidia gigantensis]KAG8532151.1 hypothetical protein KY384_003791 [Bacidia gigantensis]